MIRKFFLNGGLAIESDTGVVERTVREVAPKPGDKVYVMFEGVVDRVAGDEVEVRDLKPVKVVEVARG